MKPSAQPLGHAEARAIVALLGEVCSHSGGHAQKKRHLLDGLCRLVDAQAWVWGLFVQLEPGTFPSYTLHLHGGFDDAGVAGFLRAQEHPETARFTEPFARALQEKRTHITRMRQQLAPEEAYLGSENRKAWQAAGIDPGILSCRPIDPFTFSTVGIYRRANAPLFSERDLRLAHIILSEVPWLHELGWPDDRAASIPELSPRLCTVLNFLIHGRNRDEIAENLSLSRHTVDTYSKEIYRHFGAHSQAELMARFQNGNGGDVA